MGLGLDPFVFFFFDSFFFSSSFIALSPVFLTSGDAKTRPSIDMQSCVCTRSRFCSHSQPRHPFFFLIVGTAGGCTARGNLRQHRPSFPSDSQGQASGLGRDAWGKRRRRPSIWPSPASTTRPLAKEALYWIRRHHDIITSNWTNVAHSGHMSPSSSSSIGT
ncbi:hypothetical protein F5I97DRAFT_977141 [Phlebopus sp. FC_14]|nr:hypothetical protein F5I97DRAFT_977141 [Phlebopus sp. FC_14]